jgi:hypothetical protein
MAKVYQDVCSLAEDTWGTLLTSLINIQRVIVDLLLPQDSKIIAYIRFQVDKVYQDVCILAGDTWRTS